MRRLALILVLTIASAAAVAAPPAGAQGHYVDPFAWKKCNTKVSSKLKITAANNMRCKGAKRVLSRYHGHVKRKFKAPNGFRCKLGKGTVRHGTWRCTSSTKAFKFRRGR